VELITSTSVGSKPPRPRSLQILIYVLGDHQLLCNGFSHLVVIEKAITTRCENPLHNGWQLRGTYYSAPI
jgi:hypothetical protein